MKWTEKTEKESDILAQTDHNGVGVLSHPVSLPGRLYVQCQSAINTTASTRSCAIAEGPRDAQSL